METLEEQITSLRESFEKDLAAAKTDDALEKVRVAFLGRNGTLAALMGKMKQFSPDQKRQFGPLLQQLKQEMQSAFDVQVKKRAKRTAQAADDKQKNFDVTAYKPGASRGSLHVYTRILDDVTRIFVSMGFDIVDGPEVETDYNNFEALNIPADHPARDMQDTFWLNDPGMLLRTHTSPVQIRTMKERKPPLAIVAPGRVYRHEQTDASHDFLFTQVEGLLVDTDVSMANLMATAKTFLQAIFEKEDLKIRVRPGYFPFVEPGIEIDGSCPFCASGCSVCKKTGWIELVGAGLVHPNVLRAVDIDTKQYSGFAFGFGIERIAMIKYGINDIRLFHSSKLDFLRQF